MDFGGYFSIKSTFEPALQQLAHDSNQNKISILTQLDEDYKTSIFKTCQKKVDVNLGGAAWKCPY